MEKTKRDAFLDAIYKKHMIAVATVMKVCKNSEASIHTAAKKKNGQWLFEEVEKESLCSEGSLTLEINNSFKHPIPRIIDAHVEGRWSCDRGDFHPTKPTLVNGKIEKKISYIIGQQYLFILSGSNNYYSVRAGEKLGKVTDYYIKEYTEFNTANKPINQDK